MLRSVIENYLTSIEELEFFLPFQQLLEAQNYYDIHLIHSSIEFGKDFIAKRKHDEEEVQYIFQVKAFDIDLNKFRREVMPQLLECYINNLSHPNFNRKLRKKVILVTTGLLNSHASIAFQQFNLYLEDNLKEDSVTVWDKENLVIFFKDIGVEPFFSLHNSPEKVGSFFSFYASVKNKSPIYYFDIIEYTDPWLEYDWSIPENRLQIFFETFLFSNIFYKQNRHYESLLVLSALIRVLSKNNYYTEYQHIISEYIKEIIISFSSYLKDMLNKENSISNFNKSAFSIFYYPINCLRSLELLALYIITINHTDKNINFLFKRLLDKEVGCYHPVSDNYAISTILISCALLKLKDNKRLNKFIVNVTVWICDRYEDIGLCPIGSDLIKEFEQLLSEHLSGLSYNSNNSSYIATCILDICYIIGDSALYNSVANDFRAQKIILEFYHVLDDDSLYWYNSKNIYIECDHDFSIKMIDNYSKIIEHELSANSIKKRDYSLFYLMFILRDRYFPSFLKELLVI